MNEEDDRCFLNLGHVGGCKNIEEVLKELVDLVVVLPYNKIKMEWTDAKYIQARLIEYRETHDRCHTILWRYSPCDWTR